MFMFIEKLLMEIDWLGSAAKRWQADGTPSERWRFVRQARDFGTGGWALKP